MGNHRMRGACFVLLVVLASCAGSSTRHLDVAIDALARSPLSGRQEASAVWTGTEFIVWGGHRGRTQFADGAAYEPAFRRWTAVPAAPVAGRARHVAVWTGREMIVWGGTSKSAGVGGLLDGAAFDPSTRRWRTIAPAPDGSDLTFAHAVYADGHVVVGGGFGPVDALAGSLLVYDIERDAWTTVGLSFVHPFADQTGDVPDPGPPAVVSLAAHGAAVTAALISRGGGSTVSFVRYDVQSRRQEQLPDWRPPHDDPIRWAAVMVDGGRYVATASGLNSTAVATRPVTTSAGTAWTSIGDTKRTPFMNSVFDPMTDGGATVAGGRVLWFSSIAAASFDLRTHRFAFDDGAPDGFCGADSAFAWAGPDALAWGGQDCRGGAGSVATGVRVRFPRAR